MIGELIVMPAKPWAIDVWAADDLEIYAGSLIGRVALNAVMLVYGQRRSRWYGDTTYVELLNSNARFLITLEDAVHMQMSMSDEEILDEETAE